MPRKTKAQLEAEALAAETAKENVEEGTENMENYENNENMENMDTMADAVDGAVQTEGEAPVAVEEFNEDDFMDGDNNGDEAEEDLEAVQEAISEIKKEQADTPPAPKTRRTRKASSTTPSILTIDTGGTVETQADKDDLVWHEIKNSRVGGTPLTGIFSKMETLEGGTVIAVIDYKGQRVAIPMKEMMINIPRPEGQSDKEYAERGAKIMNKMIGADIDFIVRGIDNDAREAVASRKAAMLRLRRRYYLSNGTSGKPQVHANRTVEARIIAVSQMAIRIEVFGVETTIQNRYLSWGYLGDAREEFYVGEKIPVNVSKVDGETPETLSIRADIRSLTSDTSREKLKTLKPQSNCLGTITDVRKGVVFIRLQDGVRAIAHKCYDQMNRKPGKGDTINFIVTRIDEDGGVAIGLVSRIIKRNI